MSLKGIFHDAYNQNFYSIVNQHNFAILEKLLGADASKVACLAPKCGSSTSYNTLEKKKAYWVKMLTNALNAGISFSDLPDGCNCEQLACACSSIILTGEGVESQLIQIQVETQGVSDDVTFISSNEDINETRLAADNPGDFNLGNTSGYALNFFLPDGGPNTFSGITLASMFINGQEVQATFPDIMITQVSQFHWRVFFPGLQGITFLGFQATVAAI